MSNESLYLLVILLSVYVIYFLVTQIKHKLQSVSFVKNYAKTGLAVITLKRGEKDYNFVVDSGSTVSVYDCNFLKDLGSYTTGKSTISAMTVNGETESSGTINTTFHSKLGVFDIKLHLYDLRKSFSWDEEEYGCTVHGLLGADFLAENNLVIDFDNFKIYKK